MIPSDTDDRIAEERFPLTTAELVDRYGDSELELPNGTELLAEVLDRQGEETYETPDEVRMAVYNGVSHAAVGRRFYSDRDPTPPDSPFGPEQVSF